MAPKKATSPVTPDGQQASVAAIEAAATTPPEFTWDQLANPAHMPSKRVFNGITVKVLETVPEPIRVRAEHCLAVNVERVAKSTKTDAKRNRVDYHWLIQPVPNVKRGEEFAKLITKYAKYRPSDVDIPHMVEGSPKGQITARTGDVSWYVKDADGAVTASQEGAEGAFLGIRYSVRPFEARKDTKAAPVTG